VAVTPDETTVYVANHYSNTVPVISIAMNTITITVTISVGSGPEKLSVLPDGSAVYVANQEGNVSVISATTATVNVQVTTPAGTSLASQYTYTPDTTSLTAGPAYSVTFPRRASPGAYEVHGGYMEGLCAPRGAVSDAPPSGERLEAYL
jgi:YVTN family beta-propeller protein